MAHIEITDENYETEVLKAKGIVLVDFWAAWCGPCLMLAPTIEEISTEYAEKIKVGKLDVDANPVSAQKNNVMGIPTVILFKDGEIKETFVGVRPKNDYVSAIEKYL